MQLNVNKITVLILAPFSVLYLFFVVLLFMLFLEDSVSQLIWAWSGNELVWESTLLKLSFSWSDLIPPLYRTFETFLVSLVIFYFITAYLPIPDDFCVPVARGIDTAVNRFTGILLVVLSFYYLYGFWISGFATGFVAISALLWGGWIIFSPFEDSQKYSIRAMSFPDNSYLSWVDFRRIFNIWAEKVRKKQEYSSNQGDSFDDDRGYDNQRQSSKRANGRTSDDSSGSSSHSQNSSNNGYGSRKQQKRSSPVYTDSPWDVLGVEPGTSLKEIRKKWMELCKRYHPDLVPSGLKEETEEALKKVNVAYREIRKEITGK